MARRWRDCELLIGGCIPIEGVPMVDAPSVGYTLQISIGSARLFYTVGLATIPWPLHCCHHNAHHQNLWLARCNVLRIFSSSQISQSALCLYDIYIYQKLKVAVDCS